MILFILFMVVIIFFLVIQFLELLSGLPSLVHPFPNDNFFFLVIFLECGSFLNHVCPLFYGDYLLLNDSC